MCHIHYDYVLCPCRRGVGCPGRTDAHLVMVGPFEYHQMDNNPSAAPLARLELSVTCEERLEEYGLSADPDINCKFWVTRSDHHTFADEMCGTCQWNIHCVRMRK